MRSEIRERQSRVGIDASWIDRWADQYSASFDDDVLHRVGPKVREQGYFDRDSFLAVGRWKSRRATSQMTSNTDEMIHDVTATALAAPLPIQHLVLDILRGVAVPMASALLTVWNPEQHTVIDVRAVNSLVTHGEIPNPAPRKYPPYIRYLTVCKDLARRCNRDLRTVDRALYEANGRA